MLVKNISNRTVPFPVDQDVDIKIDYFFAAIYQHLVNNPHVSIIGVSGAPATGKSLLAKKIESSYPGSLLYDLGELTKKVDYYTPEGGWSLTKLLELKSFKNMLIIDEVQVAGTQYPQELLSSFIHNGGKVIVLSQDIVRINVAGTAGEPINPDWFIISRNDIRKATSSDFENSYAYNNVCIN